MVTAIKYFVASVVLMVTIVGISFALQTFKIGIMTLMPFNVAIKEKEESSGFLNFIMNVLWFFIGGIRIAFTRLIFGLILAITIIGLSFAKQHFKLASISLSPFGKKSYKNKK